MTGEDLFNLWAEAMAEQGCDVGSWEDMDELDRTAWDAVGRQVSTP